MTFNENGLALIEMHLGDLREALRLVDAGLARIEREFEPSQHALHRSVLRYNRAQLLTRLEGLPVAGLDQRAELEARIAALRAR